ncbi:MAG: hypothetical protein ACF8MJ_05980 [Phycisphaerales bacterium JB050]
MKIAAALMIAWSGWQVATLLFPPSQVTIGPGLLAALWAVIGLCGVGVLMRSDAARVFGGILLAMVSLLYFLGLAMFVLGLLVSSFANNPSGATTGQFLILLFTPLIALACSKVLLGAKSIGRPETVDPMTQS